MDIGGQDPTGPRVTLTFDAMAKEMSRLCGANGVTDNASKVTIITGLTDAQVAVLMRRFLIFLMGIG